MAEAYLLITEGTGAKMDMRTVGTVPDRHRQVLVVGDPVTDTAVAPVTAAFGLGVDLKRAPADPFGANADAAAGDATGSINAHLRALHTVLGTGTEAAVVGGTGPIAAHARAMAIALGTNADATVTAGAAGSIDAILRSISRDIIANIVLGGGGPVAHAVAISGNPYRLAGRALTADYTALTTGQTADLITTLGGKLITHPYSLPENLVKGLTADMTGTTSTSLIAAPSAGLRNYVTQLTIENSHATVGTWVNVQDGSGGTAFYTVYCAPGGGGVAITFPAPLRQPTTATAIYVANVTTGANVRASASGFVAP